MFSSGEIALRCILKMDSAPWIVCLNSCDPNDILEISRWNSGLIEIGHALRSNVLFRTNCFMVYFGDF